VVPAPELPNCWVKTQHRVHHPLVDGVVA
jgi:hypothetical protein